MGVSAGYVREEDEGWHALVLRDEQSGDTLEVRRSLAPDDQDVRLGTDRYCLVRDGGASLHGGLDAWRVTHEGVLVLRFEPDAVEALGVPAELRLALLPEAVQVVRRRLGALVRRTSWDDLRERRRVLALPMVPLRRDPVRVQDGGEWRGWRALPDAVGIGPDGEVVEVRRHADDESRTQVRWSGEGRTPLVLEGALRASGVQPLPGGRVLLLGSAAEEGGVDAEVWDADGRRVTAAHTGRAREHVLSTPSGDTWIGYFDEAGGGLGSHKLVRVGPDLAPRWVYPYPSQAPDLPDVFDVLALDVVGEAAWCYAYTSFHLLRVEGDVVEDHGRLDVAGARALLVDGGRGALVGGYGPQHDVVRPFEIVPGGVRTAPPVGRLALPDGGELRGVRLVARGDRLHAVAPDGRRWVVTLDQLLDGPRV